MSDPSLGDRWSRGLCGKGNPLGDTAEYIGVSVHRPGESRTERFPICRGRLRVGGNRVSPGWPRDHGSFTDKLSPEGLGFLFSLRRPGSSFFFIESTWRSADDLNWKLLCKMPNSVGRESLDLSVDG